MKREAIISAISASLIVLWVYASLSKLMDFDRARAQMLNQAFPHKIGEILTWAVPVAELATFTMLIFTKTKLAGLYASALLLLSFTIYIILALGNVFGRIPCTCGGILEKMSWGQHLLFNIFFLLASAIAIILVRRQTSFKKDLTNQKGGKTTK